MSFIIGKLKKIYYAIDLFFFERKSNGVKYIYRNNKSKKLIIIFSGIGGDYNYRRSFKKSSWDQLYIKDTWADGVSYYMYENGNNEPEKLVSQFINLFLLNHYYREVITFGSSKGGSSAIYYGIKHGVNEVYAGACQYRIGDYLGVFHENKGSGYYRKVMGSIEKTKGINILNDAYKNILENNINSKTHINLIYSTEEHTYKDDILPLIEKLDECGISHSDQIEKFHEHSMIGQVMKQICKNKFL